METQDTLYMLRGLFLSLFFSLNVSAHPMIQSWQNRAPAQPRWALSPKITFFSTSRNYDSFSQSVALNNSASVRRFYFDLQAAYGFNEDFSIFGRISALSTEVSGLGLGGQKNFGFSDQLAGASFRLLHFPNGTHLFLQGEISIPAYLNSNSVIQAKPFLGDGSMDFTLGTFLEFPVATRPLYEYRIEGGAGFTWRSKGYSSAIPWNFMIQRAPLKNGFVLSAGMKGTFSLETDSTPQSLAVLDQNRGAGGSFLINAINPSWSLAQVSTGYQTSEHTRYLLYGALPLTGKNSPDGIQIGFEIGLLFGNDGSNKKSPRIVQRGSFTEYDLEAKVISVNDQLYLFKIDQGYENGVEKGQIFDVYNGNSRVAKARVTHVKNNESALVVLEYYQEQSIDTDAIAKRVIQEP